MAGSIRRETLASTGLETMKLFERVKAIDNLVGNARDEGWPKARFAAEADRFELWAVNLGLFVSGHGSLDYRVRQAESIGQTLQRFMSGLNNSLAEVLDYCAGKADPSMSEVQEDPAGNPLDLDPVDEDFRDEASQEPGSDIDLLLDSVKDPVDRLYKLSTWIRNPSSRFASSKALHHHQIDPESNVDLLQAVKEFDYDYVSSLFLQYRKSRAYGERPTLNPPEHKDRDDDADNVWGPIRTILSQHKTDRSKGTESFLVYRIAQANTRRRQQFAYWKKHRDKLTQHTKTVTQHLDVRKEVALAQFNLEIQANEVPISVMTPARSVTTASRLNTLQPAAMDGQSNVSASEYAPSMWQPGEEVAGFPPVPKRPPSEKFFECPYCFTLCPRALLAEKAWKAHLIHDLRPYICTYEDCKNPDQLYDARQDWIGHENSSHRRVLRCPEHPDQTFSKLEEYQEHLHHGHADYRDEISVTLITHASESTLEFPDRCCPICSLSLETARALQSHIALHLERFSLFSLPRSVGEDDNDANEGGSDEVNVAFDGSRDEDFCGDLDFAGEDNSDANEAALNEAGLKKAIAEAIASPSTSEDPDEDLDSMGEDDNDANEAGSNEADLKKTAGNVVFSLPTPVTKGPNEDHDSVGEDGSDVNEAGLNEADLKKAVTTSDEDPDEDIDFMGEDNLEEQQAREQSPVLLDDEVDLESIIEKLLEARGAKRGTLVHLLTQEINYLFQKAREVFISQPILLELEAPLMIFGDIRGQYYDLLRWFEYVGFPPEANFLFLGNFDGRAAQPLETLCLLFAFKIKYPENFFLLRGKHETMPFSRTYGLYGECRGRHNIQLWENAVHTFNCMPIAAIVDEKIFCVSSGLSPNLNRIRDIDLIMRPLIIPDRGLLCDLLLATPDLDIAGWSDNDSGTSFKFGPDVVSRFCQRHDMDLIVRGNQVLQDGYEFFSKRRLVTLFSAPNYGGDFGNSGTAMDVNESLFCSLKVNTFC
ncbi:hypothetical protein FGG08_006264 [Glutinoglossum americanum]|uniref:protein-serine/threonine phosphatase n=1 Tax=Glutinoglossum americanum TaxID=1670608 RepID=A0A9P8I3T1_9PEZI|nr:hypothetical protein FGG08_006264 [Glutinoglossum americanum]